MFKSKSLAAAAALSLVAMPSIAAAQSAPADPAPAPAAEKVEGSDLSRRTAIFGGIVVVALVALILALTLKGHKRQQTSP